MTTDLQVKTIELTPAVVEFNFDELSTVLDEKLKEYQGLEFTEKEVAACKKTIAELNKGKKSLNDYRLATKKDLTVSVTEFEAKCKELSAKFDEVINPLKEQADEFEEKRRDDKRKKIQEVIDKLLDKEGLNEKHAALLIIEDSYLNKSTTLKSITEELTTKAEHLGIQQDKDEADAEVIKSHVALINAQQELNLIESTYVSSLEFQSVDEVKEQIERDVEAQLKKVKVEPTKVEAPPKKVEVIPVPEIDEELFREVYKVTATESQLDALEEYMSSQGIQWVAVTDE